jgi:transposase
MVRRPNRPGHLPPSAGEKTVCGTCGTVHHSYYDHHQRLVRDLPCGGFRIYLQVEVRRVWCRQCRAVKRERLEFLADNPRYTRRFAHDVGRRCRGSSIKDVAIALHLDWHTVKELEKEYLREQLRRAGEPRPEIIGIDEISVRKGQRYRIVVSDLVRRRPIWFDGPDRSQASMERFYQWLGPKRCSKIELAVMDMWGPFAAATARYAPQAAILYDKFHVVQHLNDALDEVRRSEYARLESDRERRFIKGQRYTLLSRRAHLSYRGRRALKLLLQANKRLQVAYLLKESFDQLWSYRSEGWARAFFWGWQQALRWQRLAPYEKFAEMVLRHWDGIAAYCRQEHKVSLGFVEGINNKIRVIQRRAYGIRDEEYLRLKVLTTTLPRL